MSLVDVLSAVGALADAHLARVPFRLTDLDADPGRAVARRADEHHAGNGQRRRLLADAARRDLRAAHPARVLQRARARVPLDEVQVFDEHLAVARHRIDHASFLAAVLAGEDVYDVALADLHRDCHELKNLRGKRDDLHEVLLAQLARHRSEDARAARVALVVDDHGGVLVERDLRSVVAPERLLRAHDDGLHDLALLDGALGRRALDGSGDDVAHARVAALRSAGDADAEQLAGARVVGDAETRLLLDHRFPSLQIALDAGEKQAAQGRRARS